MYVYKIMLIYIYPCTQARLVSVYIYIFVIERTWDLIYLKFVVTDFSLKIIGRAKRAPHWGVQSRLCVIGRAKRAPHWGVQSRFRVIYIYLCVCRGPNCARRITWPNTRMLKVSLGNLKPTSDTLIIHFDYTLEHAALAWTKKKRSLRNEKLKANGASVC